MIEIDMTKGFIMIGDSREPPLRELATLVDQLDDCRQSIEKWTEQERPLCDTKIYTKSDNTFDEVELIKQTRKCYFVRLACGTEHVLPSRLFDYVGHYTRRTGAVVQYWQGWRARQELRTLMAESNSCYARLKSDVVPRTVREVRQSGRSVPKDLVQRLKSHYRPKLMRTP